MLTADSAVSASPAGRIRSSEIRQALMADDSPFGIQGLARDTLKILKAGCIRRLALNLALRGTPAQIRDRAFVDYVLSLRPEWQEEYRVVHLIERSLWIDGHSDLVMTMLRNPSQIPDDPPQKILQALSDAIAVHPESTVWYGVPLFSDEVNAQGLPIPLTAAEVREEHETRIAAAQRNALRWRLGYRAAFRLGCVPSALFGCARWCGRQAVAGLQGLQTYWKRAKRDVRIRRRAKIVAHSEFCRKGKAFTQIPRHTTVIGRMAEQTFDSIVHANEVIADRVPGMEGMAPILVGSAPILFETLALTTVAPLMVVPMTLIACDPFLFIELPDEPNKLRFLGHWYWQGQERGRRKLHLHV